VALIYSAVPEMPVMGELPPFAFTNQSDEPVDNQRLEGKVWVANFIFTSCPSACPALTRTMQELQAALPDRDDLQFVSFTVDPETDTPAVLRDYAERFEADHERWWFLTGDPASVTATVVTGFHLHVGERVPVDGGTVYDIMHAVRFVLVDQRGRIRGYYMSDADGLASLQRDAAELLGS
jgi:protein SCO1/2